MTALTAEDIANGFTRPVRATVIHDDCGRPSDMTVPQRLDMARDPRSWKTCWCNVCGRRLPVNQFKWAIDGERVGT